MTTTLHIEPGLVHAWPTMQGLGIPEMDRALDQLVTFVSEARMRPTDRGHSFVDPKQTSGEE